MPVNNPTGIMEWWSDWLRNAINFFSRRSQGCFGEVGINYRFILIFLFSRRSQGCFPAFVALLRRSRLAKSAIGNIPIFPNIPVFQYSNIPTMCNEMLITPLWGETKAGSSEIGFFTARTGSFEEHKAKSRRLGSNRLPPRYPDGQ
jgi:hypothetical protein